LENNPEPQPQEAGGYVVKRRKPADSIIPMEGDLKKLFDHIRMLDAEGYPKAYLEWGDYLLEFDRAKLCVDSIEADVRVKLNVKDKRG
jgi:methionyl-tRNA formyltransferase